MKYAFSHRVHLKSGSSGKVIVSAAAWKSRHGAIAAARRKGEELEQCVPELGFVSLRVLEGEKIVWSEAF